MPARSPPPPPRLLLLLPLPLLLDPDSSSLTSVTTTLSESFESSIIVSAASDEDEDEMSNCGAARIAAMEAASASRISDLFCKMEGLLQFRQVDDKVDVESNQISHLYGGQGNNATSLT